MSMKIEKADANDIAALVKMRIEYLLSDYGSLPNDQLMKIECSLPGYYQKHLGRDLFVYVARAEQIVSCSFLLISEKPSNPSFINGRIGTVLNVYTKPAYRRQGIARKLMERLITDANELELDYLELKATADGYPLYRSLGFQDAETTYQNMKMVF